METKGPKVEAQGKRKPWYQVKIEELEAKVAILSSVSQETVTSSDAQTVVVPDSSYTDGYANGFFDCMGKYGVLSKLQRRRIKELILAKGPSAVKATKRTRFALSVPSL